MSIKGIFLSAQDPKALGEWYRKHLGIDVQPWGGAAFSWTDPDGKPTTGTTIWFVSQADGNRRRGNEPRLGAIAGQDR